MLEIDLHESQEDRMRQAAEALLAAAYDPITFTSSWHADLDKLGPMARERLMRITEMAVKAAHWGEDEGKALAWLEAVSNHLITPADWNA